jgi:hypothetical protein
MKKCRRIRGPIGLPQTEVGYDVSNVSKSDASQSRNELASNLADLFRNAEREGAVAEVIASFDDWVSTHSRQRKTASSEPFLDRAQRLDARGHTDAALDIVFDQIDEMLLASEFSRVDRLLAEIAPENLSVDLLLGLLTVTLPAKSQLSNRKSFFERVDQSLRDRGEARYGLLVGLD